MTRLSIIIELKNNLADFNDCISSACLYMGKDIEIIVVTEHKTQDKETLISNYINKDKRIKVIYNKGDNNLNTEIFNQISGKYIALSDSSSLLDRSELSKTMAILNKIEDDIVIMGYNIALQNGNIRKIKSSFKDTTKFEKIDNDDLIKKLIMPDDIYFFKSLLLKTEFAKNNGINFNRSSNVMDNLELDLSIFDNASSILVKDIHLFTYRIISTNKTPDFNYGYFDILKNYCDVQNKYLKKWNASKNIISEVYCYEFLIISQLFYKAFKNSESTNKTFHNLKEIIKSNWVKNIIHNIDDKKIDEEYKKILTAFKIGNIRMLWIVYKFKIKKDRK